MDFYTANAASTLHAERARRAMQEAEYRRVRNERAAELAALVPNTPVTPAARKHRRGVTLSGLFHSRPRTAQ